jgi:predicted small lipoprotein YifL
VKTSLVLLALVLTLSACGENAPSEKFLKNTVLDQMHINAAPAAAISAAEKGEIDKLDCHRTGANLDCAFDLGGQHHSMVLVRTGSGDWSPDAIK